MANRQLESRRPVCFATVPELLDQLRDLYSQERKRSVLSVELLKTCPLLILDDLRVDTTTAWGREKLYQILNYRYDARLATLVTLTDPALESLDERIRSRLLDPKISNPVPIGAPDYRGQARPSPRARRRR